MSNVDWSQKSSTGSSNYYDLQEGRIVTKRRYISPIRIKNKTTYLLNAAASKTSDSTLIQASTPTIPKSKSIDECGSCQDFIEEKPNIPYRTEKRNPLGTNTRLSCYKPQKNKLRDKSNNLLYNSVDDFLLLNNNNNSDDGDDNSTDDCATLINNYYTSTPKRQQPSPSLSTSTTKSTSNSTVQTPKNQRRKSEHFCNLVIKLVEDNKMSKSNNKMNEDENIYGFTEAPTIYQQKLFDDAEKNPSSFTPTTANHTKKDSSCFSNKIKAMSDRTQKLFSKLYRPSNGLNGTSESFKRTTTTLSNVNNFEKNLTNKQRSFSYGSLIGIDDLSQNKMNKIICPSIKIDGNGNGDNEDDENVTTNATAAAMMSLKIVDNSDGDSGILVNESGASSMMETEECAVHEPPMLPVKNCDENSKDFKLVRLKVIDGRSPRIRDDVGLGLILVPGSGFNCRYKVESVVPGGLAERLVAFFTKYFFNNHFL